MISGRSEVAKATLAFSPLGSRLVAHQGSSPKAALLGIVTAAARTITRTHNSQKSQLYNPLLPPVFPLFSLFPPHISSPSSLLILLYHIKHLYHTSLSYTQTTSSCTLLTHLHTFITPPSTTWAMLKVILDASPKPTLVHSPSLPLLSSEKFRNSSVMLEAEHYRPKLFFTVHFPLVVEVRFLSSTLLSSEVLARNASELGWGGPRADLPPEVGGPGQVTTGPTSGAFPDTIAGRHPRGRHRVYRRGASSVIGSACKTLLRESDLS
ncbi:hypothetical protein FAVG1_06703 [Fusarium avenaceum]|nr:hypothetical protein FAVG1_06703 [Fusarium avenaceum]